MKQENHQPPQPLHYLTAIHSMKAINRIFKDQLADSRYYSPVIISAPFKLTDFESFGISVDNAISANIDIRNSLNELHDLATSTIDIYTKIEAKPKEGQRERCYSVSIVSGTLAANSEKGVNSIKHEYRQEFLIPFLLFEFCKQVADFTATRLNKTFTNGVPDRNTKPKKENQPPKPLIDYLDTDDNNKSLEYLKAQFSNQKGQAIAHMIFALKSIHALKNHDLKNLWKSISADFGNVGSYESVRDNKVPDQTNPKQHKKYKEIALKVIQNIRK